MPDPVRLTEIRNSLAALRGEHLDGWAAKYQTDVTDLLATYDELVGAVLAFAAKYDELDPAVRAAFVFQATHGFPYTGPTWEVERRAMLALARAGRGGTG